MTLELGPTLREAREARQLAFEEVGAATRIHPRHLAALEAERFETLPGRAYARSFLHEYAQYLGLEPSLYVAEYDLRYAPTRVAPQPLVEVRRRRNRSIRGWFVLGTAVLVAGVALAAWKLGDASQPAHVAAEPKTSAPAPAPKAVVPPAAVNAAPVTRKLVVLNANDRCWISVRSGSAGGAVLYEGILEAGMTKTFAQRPLWVRFGAPWSVRVRLDGRPVALPNASGPVNVLFTSTAQPV